MRSIKYVIVMILLIFPATGMGAVVFEDDFSNDGGWSANCSATISQISPPSKWSGYRCQYNSTLDIDSGAGRSGTPALRIGYPLSDTAGAMSLFKHLTGSQNSGYNELYIRYYFKFDDDWKSGTNGADMEYWKWVRLWQGIHPTDQSQWSEINNLNTRYVIANFNTTAFGGNACVTTTWADNAPGHSAGGPRYKAWYDKASAPGSTEGCLNGWPGLTIQKTGSYAGYFSTYPSSSQSWHVIEYHFKLSTQDSPGNGVFEVWVDGNKQSLPMPYGTAASGGTMSYLNTMSYNGGMNLLTVFDNMGGWSKDWSSAKFIYIDNVVVSTSYIGPSYTIGGGTSTDTVAPAPPTGLQ